MRLRLARLIPLLCALPCSLAAQAQDERPETYGHSEHGTTFDEGPRQAAYLMPGLGDQVHFPVEGLSDEAQRFFNQGITQQHGFWHFEAERSFRQVAKLHPECAMAYWGMARANDENAERAAGFIANAVQRRAGASERERKWIDAWARYYRIDDDDEKELLSGDKQRVEKAIAAVVDKNKERSKKDLDKLDKQLLKDLGTIVYEYPDDIEAKAFLAIQNWLAYRWGSGVAIVSHTAVDALLDQVFEKAPLHPAHHYRIHLWDREDARRALGSAAKNGDTAMAIAHQWHMSGHIYAKLDRHAEAAWQQEASGRADHAHMMRDGVMPFLIHNYGHNQEWLARSLSHCGEIERALEIAKNMAELPRHPTWNRVDERGDIAYYGRERLVQICQDHGLWQRALELAQQGFLEPCDEVEAEARRLRVLGRASFRLGRREQAEGYVAAAKELLTKARAERARAVDEAEQKAFDERKKRKELRERIAEASREPTDAVALVLDVLRELSAERLLADGDAKAAWAELDGVRGVPLPVKSHIRVAAGEVKEAIEALEKANEKNPKRAATMAALIRAYGANHPESRPQLRELVVELAELCADDYLGRLGIAVDAYETPQLAAANKPGPGIELVAPGGSRAAVPAIDETAGFGDDFGERPPLASIGPRCWSRCVRPASTCRQSMARASLCRAAMAARRWSCSTSASVACTASNSCTRCGRCRRSSRPRASTSSPSAAPRWPRPRPHTMSSRSSSACRSRCWATRR